MIDDIALFSRRVFSSWNASALALCLALSAAAIPAHAGTLHDGNWKPSPDCGQEPPAPVLHAESASAYQESVKWVQLYQTQINAYIACMVRDANADTSTISDTVKAAQHRANEAFRQFNEATEQISHHHSDDSDSTPRRRGGKGLTFGTGGGD